MVGHHDQAVGEIAPQSPIVHLVQLILHTLVASDPNHCRCPPLCHGSHKDGKRFLGPSHVSIVKFRVNQLQRGTNELGCTDSELRQVVKTMFRLFCNQPKVGVRYLRKNARQKGRGSREGTLCLANRAMLWRPSWMLS